MFCFLILNSIYLNHYSNLLNFYVMKHLFLLIAVAFSFMSCNKYETIDPTIDPANDIVIQKQTKSSGVLYTITVPFAAGSCTISNKAKTKLQNELQAISAQHSNMALVQVTGHHWEGNTTTGVPLCDCRANTTLSEFNRWAASNGVGQSFGITTCQTHIHSGLENQVAVLQIDAFL
jgi:hypothetical protein